MVVSPKHIRAFKDEGELEIHWQDGTIHRMSFRFLRGSCPCAGCVNEFTGVRTLDVNSVPETIRPDDVNLSGNYALKFSWNDGHDTGLYTWDYLWELGQSDPSDTAVET